MLIILLALGAVALLVLGYILCYKNLEEKATQRKELGNTMLAIGWGLLIILLIGGAIAHFTTANTAIILESKYYTYYSYSVGTPTDALIINASSLSCQPETCVGLDLATARQDIFDYNQNLYSLRQWAKDSFIGIALVSPNSDLKPIILK
jgi:hypothetical protein